MASAPPLSSPKITFLPGAVNRKGRARRPALGVSMEKFLSAYKVCGVREAVACVDMVAPVREDVRKIEAQVIVLDCPVRVRVVVVVRMAPATGVFEFVLDNLAHLVVWERGIVKDVADGLAARMFHQITSLGKLLDPIADKLSLLTLLVLFVLDGQIQKSLSTTLQKSANL